MLTGNAATSTVNSKAGRTKKMAIGAAAVVIIILVLLYMRNMDGLSVGGTNLMGGSSTNSQKGFRATENYKLWIVADRDEFSKSKSSWESTLWNGKLRFGGDKPKIGFTHQYPIFQHIVRSTRGVELSELLLNNNKLYTFCDRTGVAYEILNYDSESGVKRKLVPRAILAGGDGNQEKPQKNEWAFERNGEIYVGSWGKEWTSPDGKTVVNKDPQYVKVLNENMQIIRHEDWSSKYLKLREATGTTNPGYLVHEAVAYEPQTDRLYFAPRRVSKEAYNDEADLRRGANIVISCKWDFSDAKVITIKQHSEPTRGFSALRFVPGRSDLLLALKTEEKGKFQKSYITLFDTQGNVKIPEQFLGDEKFEGLAIKPLYDE